MIERVADHVRQRIAHVLDDRGVDLHLVPLDDQLGLLAVRERDVPHRPLVAPEDRPDGDHARLHDLLLQVEQQPIGLAVHLQRLALARARRLEQGALAAAGHGDLAGQPQHAIQLLDVDAQRPDGDVRPPRRGDRRRRPARRFGGRRGRGRRRALDQQVALQRDGHGGGPLRQPLLAGDGARNRLPDHVDRRQELGGERRPEAQLVLAQPIEHVLEQVRELGHRPEAQGGGVPLDGVGAPEDRAQSLLVAGIALQRDQRLLDGRQVLLRLGGEGLDQQIVVDLHLTASRPARSRRRC